MKNKKLYIGISVGLVVYLLVFIIYLNRPGINERTKLSIAFNPAITLSIQEKEWKLFQGIQSGDELKYDIYLDGKIQGKMELRALDRWYAFQNGISYQYDQNKKFIGTYSNQKLTFLEDQVMDDFTSSDVQYINEALKGLNSKYTYQDIKTYSNKRKIVADFDHDEMEESLYYFSNTMKSGYQEFFTLVFLVDDDKIIYVTKEKSSGIYEECNPDYLITLNINNGKENHIISSCSYFSNMGRCAYITTAKAGHYETTEACLEE